MSRLKSRLRAEEGMTLIELLIAMTVMSIGIAALVAGFSSGVVSINHSTADLDRWFARGPADGALPPGAVQFGAGRRSLRIRAPARTVTTTGCRSTVPGHALGRHIFRRPAPTGRPELFRRSGTPASRPVKLLTISVRDGSSAGETPLQRELDLRLLDQLTTHST